MGTFWDIGEHLCISWHTESVFPPRSGVGFPGLELGLSLSPHTLACDPLSLLTPYSLCLARLLKDGLKDSQFSIRYQYLLAALLCCCGKGLRDEFNRQCWLVNTLAKLAQQVREAAPSARQVSGDRLPLPISSPRLLQPVINFLGILTNRMALDQSLI